MKVVVTGLVAAAVLCASMSEARAVDVLSTFATNAVGNCQGALPVYEALIRKRPLAIVNEGTQNAFVICAFTSEQLSLGITAYGTRLTNTSAIPQTVTCTGVTGEEGSAQYFVKAVGLPPGESRRIEFSFLLDNLGILFDSRLSLSCRLPPGVGLNDNSVTTLIAVV
ncbi:MAG: hypothetical protein ACREO8_06975 [Luteimonas sp.]